jgi:hypothetical protein
MVLGGSGIQHPLVILIALAGIIPNARAQVGPPGLLFSEGFEDLDLIGRGWYDGRRFTLSDEYAAAGKRSIQYHFPEGRITPDDSSGVRHLIEPTEVVYLRFSLKLSPGWSWTGRPYGPHLLHFLTTASGQYHGPARSHLTLYIEPVGGKLRLATQDIQNQEMPHGLTQGPLKGGYNGQFFDSKDVLFNDDKWHLVEVMFKLNSLDLAQDRPRADGELRGWVDGRLVIERTDVVFRSADFPDMKFNQFLMLPYFHHGVPHDQTLWIDELAVGTGRLGPVGQRDDPPDGTEALERIEVSQDKKGFVLVPSGQSFIPWGFNYDHDEKGRLIEDYWAAEWPKVEEDFREMKDLGANVVRVHLQLGKFMDDSDRPDEENLGRLARLLDLAERTGLYLDLTGLGCYHKQDVPAWYDALTEQERWATQARFWEAVARRCADSPAVFCYDLMNEPVVPGGKREPGDWLGPGFAGKHFVQFITLDQDGRPRPEIARQWVRTLTQAIRRHDRRHPVTVGLVPWSLDRPGLTSGFVPKTIAPDLDFVAVHLYPEASKVDEALETLQGFAVGKPIVIEETFPLKCSVEDQGRFIEGSRGNASGWIGFYWGRTPEELRPAKTISDALTLGWLEFFRRQAGAIRR